MSTDRLDRLKTLGLWVCPVRMCRHLLTGPVVEPLTETETYELKHITVYKRLESLS
jgi:hypothetical protein